MAGLPATARDVCRGATLRRSLEIKAAASKVTHSERKGTQPALTRSLSALSCHLPLLPPWRARGRVRRGGRKVVPKCVVSPFSGPVALCGAFR